MVRKVATALALVAGGTLVVTGPVGRAAASETRGHIQLQYQNVDNPLGSRSFFNRIFEINHAGQIRSGLDFRSQLEFRQLSYLQGPEDVRVPRGMLQLTGVGFGVTGSYRPTRQIDATGFRSNLEETAFTAYLARPSLPRVDLNWTRRDHSTSGPMRPAAAITRSARISKDLGRFNLHGGYGDITEEPENRNLRRTSQRTYDAGGVLPVLAGPVTSLVLQYDFLLSNGETLARTENKVRTHSGTAVGGVRLSPTTDLALNYLYRRSEVRSQIRSNLNDHDGTLLLNYRPTTAVRISAGGGLRTARTGEDEEVLKNAIVSAAASGKVRPGWTGQAGLTHTRNWFPGGRNFAVSAWNGSSRFRLARRLETDLTLNMSANGDTGAVDRKDVAQVSYGITGYPLRTTRMAWRGTLYRAGSSFTTAAARSSSNTWELRWTPFTGFEIGGLLTRTRSLAGNDDTSTNRQYTLKWSSAERFQVDVNYLKNDRAQANLGGAELPGRESINARILIAMGRLTRFSAAVNTADPGKDSESRQVDIVVTRNFGR